MPRLALSNIEKNYGATQALSNGALELHAGEVHMLVGSNGSGKSTLCKIIAGSVRPDRGTIKMHGNAIDIPNPAAARDAGVSIFFQELSLANNRTVAENIVMNDLPCHPGVVGRGFVDRSALRDRAELAVAPYVDVVGADFTLDTPVGQLRADQRQLVEIMKTCQSGGDIIIFDEPTSALDRAQSEAFFKEIDRLKMGGAAIVFISHRMEEVFEIGDRISVIRDGTTVFSAPISETSQEELVAEMVGGQGRTDGFAAAPEPRQTEAMRLRVTDLTCDGLQSISFEVGRGEILGLGGLHGQGQSTLLRSLFGLTGARGQIELDGKPIAVGTPKSAIRQGMAYVSGDRGRDGAITDRPIFENVMPIRFLRRATGLVRPRQQAAEAEAALARLSTKYAGLEASINALSGGNQQKVIIARWLIDLPDVLLLDDPTKGIDIATKMELFDLIRGLADQGMSILLYSSEDAELLANSDRILVFNNGGVSRALTGADRTRTNLTQAAFEAA